MKNNLYQIVTDKIIDQLSQGYIPWEKPWFGVIDGAFNRITKRPYSLLNQMLLLHKGEYATFKQWTDLGGKIKKGSKSEIVVFWKLIHVDDKNESGVEDPDKKDTFIPVLRYYNVFHISQVEGVEPLSVKEKFNDVSPIDEADKILSVYIAREGINFVHEAGNKASYNSIRDQICVPLMEQFVEAEEYYSTAFHEAVHSTGHRTRLARQLENSFGSTAYAKEELVAELGAAFLMNNIGISVEKTEKNNAAYIQSWIRCLQNDNRLIVSAAGKAEKAVNFIQNGREAEVDVA